MCFITTTAVVESRKKSHGKRVMEKEENGVFT
jgi:hypothetical protein